MAVTITYLDKTPTRLRLQINNPAGDNIGKVMRTDANGARTVRVESGALPSTLTSLVVTDYEYPLLLEASITYTVYSVANVALGSLVIGPGSPGFNVETGLLHLTVPTRPEAGLLLNDGDGAAGGVVVTWDQSRETGSTVHQVVGRTEPVVVLRPALARTGSMEVLCPDLPTARNVEKTLAQPYVFLLRQSDLDSIDLYFVPTTVAAAHTDSSWSRDGRTERRWVVTVAITEVGWPTGYVVPIKVWTFNDVAAQYGDFNAVAATFATFTELLERIDP